MNTHSALGKVALLIVCAAAVTSCGGDSPATHLSSAKSYLSKQDPAAAIIELKNALQKAPDSGEARFLLGRALFDRGDASGATVELRKARDLQFDISDVAPLLARSLNASGQSKAVIDEFASTSLSKTDAQAELKVALSYAYDDVGKSELAEQSREEALHADPDNLSAQLATARHSAVIGHADDALRSLDALLNRHPKDVDGLLLKADLLRLSKRQPDAALPVYRQALASRGSLIGAQAGVVAILLDKNDLDNAATQLAEMKKFWPNALQTRWWEAQLAFRRHDVKTASAMSDQLLGAVPGDVEYLYFSGVVGLNGGSVVKAESSLSKAIQIAPDNVPIRRQLARANLRLGQPEKALAVVEPLVARDPPDSEALVLAAQAQLLLGDQQAARSTLARAVKVNPKDSVSRTALAADTLSRGDVSAGLADLRAIAASDAGVIADLQLIGWLTQNKRFDEALGAVDNLGKKQPQSPLPHFLRGVVLAGKNNLTGARASLESALALDPTYYQAVAALARLDTAEKVPGAARKRLEQYLTVAPKNMNATLALIKLREAEGASADQMIAMIKSAIALDETAPAPRAMLVEQYLAAKDVKAALEAARAGAVALPDNLQVLDALAQAQLASGDRNQAIDTYSKLAALQPQSVSALLRIAEINASSNDLSAARQNLARALEIDPAGVLTNRASIAVELADGKRDAAIDRARNLQRLRPKEETGFLFEGNAQLAVKNYPTAAKAYREALARGNSTQAAVGLQTSLQMSGRQGEANAYTAARLKEFPNDAGYIMILGDLALVRKDYVEAYARYNNLLSVQPESPMALNNLAWLKLELHRDGALAYAEKANALQPNQPQFIDTLASAMAAERQLPKAIELQKKLVQSNPAVTIYRLHLAQMYVQAGNKELARPELERLSALGDRFVDRDAVARLLKSL